MRAAVVTEPGRLEVSHVTDPTPRPLEAVVEVERCGVCGTDLHVLDGDAPNVTYPVIPGHEFSGRVVAVGAGVAEDLIGRHVAVDPMVFCGHCRECRSGWTNLCTNGGGLGTTAPGAFATYVAVSASQCEPVPEAVPPAWAQLAEPLSCALHALDRIGPVLGTEALVFGAGPAGLMITRLLTLGGASVDVVERQATRAAVAESFGAERTAPNAEELGGEGAWTLVVDATGNGAAIATGLGLVRRAGTFAVFGVSSAEITVPLSPYEVFSKELTIVGSNSVRHTFGRALATLARGVIPGDALLDAPFSLEEIGRAFDQTREARGLKATVLPPH